MSNAKYRRKAKHNTEVDLALRKQIVAYLPEHMRLQRVNMNVNPPSPFIPDSFIRELNSIGGLTETGKPRYRVVWGPDQTVIAYGQKRLKYLLRSRRVPTGWEVIQNGERIVLPLEAANDPKYPIGNLVFEWLDWGKPFFYLEEWCPPEIACEEWELHRWTVDETKLLDDPDRMIPVYGEAPREGLYREVLQLKDKEGKPLYPSQETLDYVRKIIKIKEDHPVFKQTNWRSKPHPSIVAEYITQKYKEIYESEQEEERRLIETYEEVLKPHAHRLRGVTDPGNGHIIIR